MVHDGPAERRRRFMAVLTGTRRWEVVRRFGHDAADPRLAGPMTRRATRRNARMVHWCPRSESRRGCRRPPGMTGPALGRGDRNVIYRLADRRATIMTPPHGTGGSRRNRW